MKKQHQYEKNWLGEINEKLGYKLLLKTNKIIYRGGSKYNPQIFVIETKPFGKVLLLGEEGALTLQYSERLAVYDEMLSHVPMSIHPNPEKILIIGGGDGGVLKNVLMYKKVKKVVLVEIDKKIVEIAREIFGYKFLDEPRVEVVYKDGAEYIKEVHGKFDVVIGDYTDPYSGSPAETLVTQEFYNNIKKILNKESVFTVQSGSPIYQPEILRKIYTRMRKTFGNVKLYCSPAPIYPGGIWCYTMALVNIMDVEPKNEYDGETDYYNWEIHQQAFKLPEFVKKIVGEEK